ncbi:MULTISPECIES: MutS-related protein [unclassified Myroides]|uniref:MutS-related protein n=1 Tax=unclassified Myroides TaxID=2642485 RepID=UPI003D2F8E18
MNWLFALLILLVGYYLWTHHRNKQKQIKRNKQLLEDWGNPKTGDFDLVKIKRYREAIQDAPPSYQQLGEQENLDLDLDEVFMYLDRTITPIGQQYLYNRLHTIEENSIKKQHKKLEEGFATDPELRKKTHALLQPLNTQETYYFHYLFTHPIPLQQQQYTLAWALTFLHIVLLLSLWFYPLLSVLFIVTLPINLVIHYKNKFRLYEYQNGISQLRKIRHALEHLALNPLLQPFVQGKVYFTKLKGLTRLTHGFDNPMHGNEITTLLWFPVELVKITFNIESILFHLFARKLGQNKQDLHEAFTALGTIELALSNASCKVHHITCTPIFHKEKRIIAEGLYHPLVENCTPNDLHLNCESLLLTGSNMSGKTTFIRTVALNLLLGQTLGFAFARSLLAPFCRLHTSIRIADDLLKQTSYYLKEVETIKSFLDQSATSHFNVFILDEILKGTNTAERIGASTAILRYLNNATNFVLVSTHDLELIQLLADSSYVSHYFSEIFDEQQQLYFDYTLKKGVPSTTNAIRLLQLYEYPDIIVEQALQLKRELQ